MSKHTRRARCHITAFDELECTIPFPRGVVEEWKRAIPYARRSYDPQTKAWRFWSGYQDVAIDILLRYFPDAELPRAKQKHDPSWSATTGHDHFAVLHLRETAPRELIDAAYRCLSKIFHPDLGGDPAVMREINTAHDALTRRLSA